MGEAAVSPFAVSGATTAAFWIISALAVGAALMVVTVRSVFRAALFLALSFTGVAGLYFLMNAEFVGIVQIVVYVGAVSVLIVFAIMLVRDVASGNQGIKRPTGAALVAGLVAAALIYVGYETVWTRSEDLRNQDAVAGIAGSYVAIDPPVAGRSEIVRASSPDAAGAKLGVLTDSTGTVGTLLVRDYLLAFEVIGVVLAAALIGSLALMRDRRVL